MVAASFPPGPANEELRIRARSSLPMHLALIVVLYALTGQGAAWILPMAAVTALRLRVLNDYPGVSAPDSVQWGWRWRFKLGAYICALVWASLAGFMVLKGAQSWSTLLIFLLMSGISSGGVTALAPDYQLSRNFVLLLNFPPFVVGFFSGSWSAVVLLALYQLFLIRQGRQQYDWFWKGQEDNRQLGLVNAALEEAKKARSDLFATGSHELRTPLTLILGPLDSLRQTPLDDSQRALVETMARNGRHLLNMVNELLDFTRLDARKFEVRRRGTQVDTLSRGVFDAFLPSATAAGQVWSAHIDPQGEVRSLDVSMVERILFNLLSNALKFTRSGGAVSLSVESRGDRLRFIVTDTGVGIAETDLARVFAQFEQAPNSPNRRYEGTGLGLSIVKQFCQLLGGDVTVTSQIGHGSTFRADILAPLCDERESGPLPRGLLIEPLPKVARGEGEALPSAGSRPLVLLVEDNDELARYMTESLDQLARVERAFDGVDGLERARLRRPQLVITDVMMPRMDGLELCRQLKQDKSLAEVPVMVLTASARQETMLEAWSSGADEFLMKPFHTLELLTRTRGFLKAQEERERAETERRRLELALRQAEKQAALRTMGGGVAHTFNNLLTVAVGALDLARAEEGMPASALPLLDDVAEALERATRTTRSLALYLNCWPCRLEPLDLAEICAGDLGVECERSLAPAPIRGHKEQLLMMVRGLLDNALEAHGELPPRISLETGCRQVGANDPGELQAGRWSYLKVSDLGCGMDEATRLGMLDPFFSTKFTGRGLGLAVLAGLLPSHQAALQVDSEPGKGTTVWVYFPC